ncbi:unnamed protein product, partial [Staurois parvus]
MQGPGRADIVNAGSGESGYSECRVQERGCSGRSRVLQQRRVFQERRVIEEADTVENTFHLWSFLFERIQSSD